MTRYLIHRAAVVGMTAVLLASTVATVSATVWTDQADYIPGSVVTISGDNSNGAGYLPGETVHVDVAGPNGYRSSCDATADGNGAWSCQVTLWDNDFAVGDYTYTATGQTSGVTESGTFTDAHPPTYNAAVTSPLAASPVAKDYSDVLTVSGTVTCTNSTHTACPAGVQNVPIVLQLQSGTGGGAPWNAYVTVRSTTVAVTYSSGVAQNWSFTWQVGKYASGQVPPDTYDLRVVITPNTPLTRPGGTLGQDALTITKEDTTTAYGGDTNGTEGGSLNLSATVADESDGSTFVPDTYLASTAASTDGVRYELFDTAGCTGTSKAGPIDDDLSNAGVATGATMTLGAGVSAGTYYMKTTYLGNTYYNSSSDCDSINVAAAVPTTGTLRVTKIVSGGNKTADDFQFDVSGPTPSSDNAFEVDGTNDITVDVGTYTVTEDAEVGYTAGYSNCTDVVIDGGETETCTITNTFIGYDSTTASTLDSSSFTIGGSVTDTAVVTGIADAEADPSGSIEFYLCGPTAPAAANPDCSSGGTLKDTVALVSDGVPGTYTSSASSGAITPTAAGRYCFRAEYDGDALYNASSDYDASECFIVNPASATVVYLGQFDDADGQPTTLSASVTSSYEACAASREVTFDLDGAVYDYTKTATTGSATGSGPYTGTASTVETLGYDIYDVDTSVADKDLGSDGIPECSAASAAGAILTVAEPGAAAHGGGWYKDDTATPPRVNFGFTVKLQKDGTYKGQILWMNNSSWKLKGTLDGFGFFACPTAPSPLVACGLMTGTGTLYEWNGTDWVNPQAVSFSARFWDGGFQTCAKKTCNKQERPDYFGMQIASVVIAPESDPMRLWGGALYGKPL